MKDISVYGLGYVAEHVNSGAYYSLTLTKGIVHSGAATIEPRDTAYTYFSVEGALQLQAPPGSVSIAGKVSADEDSNIIGTILVSPPINSDTVVVLRGAGTILDRYILRAGETQGQFAFKAVDTCEAHKELPEPPPREKTTKSSK
jgi:hypothetical protein